MVRRLGKAGTGLVCALGALSVLARGEARGDDRAVGVRLGSRLAPVDVRLPEVRRGASAPFTWVGSDGAEHAGWVAALPLDAVVPSPSFGDGLVHVGGGFSSHEVYAFDARTGRPAWRASAPDGGPSAAIVVGDKVLFNTESCTLFCVDARTGRQLWKKWLGDPLMSQPASDGRLVFSAHIVSGGGGYALTALRIADGSTAWTETLDADGLSAPVVSRGRLFLTTMGGRVIRFDAATGDRIWDEDLGATSAPWVDGNRVYVARRRSEGREQQVVLDAGSGDVIHEGAVLRAAYAAGRPDAGGVAAGWGFEGSRPVLAAGRAYYAMGQELRARDLETGEEVWRRALGSAADARGLTPPAIVGGTAVVGTRTGELYGIDIDTGLATFAVRIGEPIAWQPIVAKGFVYVTTTHGRLVGLEVSDEAFDGWHMWGGSPAHTGPVASDATAPRARPTAAATAARPTEGALETEVDGRRERFPLKGTRVRMQVSGFVVRAEVEQTFDNPFDRPLDAAYVFPLPTDAAVDEMEIAIGDRVVRGRIARRAEARRVFAEARARGVLAALLETESAELFRQAVANVPPHTAVRVRLSYAAVLPYHDGAYHLTFPLVAAPRYTADGAGALTGPGSPADERPAGEVDLEVAIDAGVPLESLESPTHRLRVTRRGPRTATVALAPGDRMPNRDFVLDLGVAADAPRVAALSTAHDRQGTVSLLVHPRADTPDAEVAAREVVLLLDASSSMRGRPLAQARAVADQVLSHLRPNDTFRLVAFSDRARALDARALPATPETLAAARAFLAGVSPRGGTEMGRALDEALAPAVDPARVRLVVLASDGLVGEERGVLSRIATHLGRARLYGLGLGAAPNRYLLERAAEAGRGEALYATLGDDPAEVAARLARRIDRPVLTDLEVDWGGLPVQDIYPRVLPDLHADRPLVVHARYAVTEATPSSGTVTLHGRIAGRSWSATVPVSLPAEAPEHRALGAVWARARVTDLETAAILQPTPELREQIAETGLTFGLVTRETSFVAVDEGTHTGGSGPGASFTDAAQGGGSTAFASGGGGDALGMPAIAEYDLGPMREPAILGRPFRLTVGALMTFSPALADRGWSRVPGAAGFAAMAALGSGICLDGRVFLGVTFPEDDNEPGAMAFRTDHRAALCPHFGPLTLLLAAGPALSVDDTGRHLGASGGTGVILQLGRFALRHEIDAAWLGAPSLSFSLGFGFVM